MVVNKSKYNNDSFFKKVLFDRFKSIKGSELLIEDYKNFNITVTSIPEELKIAIIRKFDNLTCNSKEFKNRFHSLSFKEAFIRNYYGSTKTPRCCFCGQILEKKVNDAGEEIIVADIEHIFPKSRFPQFALHPNNFAPCCKECNEVIKGDKFFEENPYDNFKTAIKDLNLNFENLHPLELWKNIRISDDDLNFTIVTSKVAKKFLNFYNLEKRIEILYRNNYSILLNFIHHSDIGTIESLEKLLENIASSNWSEINDGYSINNSPQIWQEFIENILYDECKLMALWDEVKASRLQLL